MEVFSMTAKEITRLQIMQQLKNKTIKQKEAAKMLSLSTIQIKRLYKNFKLLGSTGLISKKRGMKGNHSLSDVLKSSMIDIILNKYNDFGPTLTHEKLVELHNINASLSTIRSLMIKNHIWIPKRAKNKPIHQTRERRSCIGELSQIDGSFHDWFEGRGNKCTLLVYIDDATSKLLEIKFVNSESTRSYMNATKNYILKHGRPLAFYSDKHSVFRINKNDYLHGNGLTQFGRMLKELDINLICANSPQAKGRVERANRTLQDRLIKEMRLKNITNMEEANLFLPEFLESFNNKFAKESKNNTNMHRSIDKYDIEDIFTLKETRILSKNLECQYKNKLYQIITSRPSYTLKNAKVILSEDLSGKITIKYKDEILKYTIFEEYQTQGQEVSAKSVNSIIDKIKYKPKKSHPYKRYYPRQAYALIG